MNLRYYNEIYIYSIRKFNLTFEKSTTSISGGWIMIRKYEVLSYYVGGRTYQKHYNLMKTKTLDKNKIVCYN
jgi:hypothetical protein